MVLTEKPLNKMPIKQTSCGLSTQNSHSSNHVLDPFLYHEGGPLSCHVILNNNSFSSLQCLGWKTLQGHNSFPPAPLVHSKTQSGFLWLGGTLDEDIRAAFTYRCNLGVDEGLSLFLYFHISKNKPNSLVLKLLQGEGIPLNHLQSLEQNFQPVPCMAEAHERSYHSVAVLSETSSAVLVVDLWSDYG